MELVDQTLGSEFDKEEAIKMIKIALLCTNPSPTLRPTMSTVVSMLESQSIVPEFVKEPSVKGDQSRFQALTNYVDQLRNQIGQETQSNIFSWDAINSSSSSATDHHHVNLKSQ